jgi:hypothetical protein
MGSLRLAGLDGCLLFGHLLERILPLIKYLRYFQCAENKSQIKLKTKNTLMARIVYVESVMRTVGRSALTLERLNRIQY